MANLINRKKGETVHMYAFTGMYLGEFIISDADKKSVTLVQKNGRTTKFSREDGKQLDAKTPRCASRITEEKEPEKKKPVTKKSKTKKTEETTEEAPAKTTKKKAPAKKAKVEEPEEVETDDDDDEDYEEV
jgi:outer membrane biosynthesis protein TonB